MKGKRDKWKLADFDQLQQVRKSPEGSIWQGGKGIYVIRHIEGKAGARLPLAKVILNNQFLTGLFRTKNNAIYSGDMKEGGKKRFLLFKIVDSGKMEVKVSL